MSLVDVRELSIDYGDGPVVDRLSFAIDTGESLGIVGESGAGKSQTALALLGLLPKNARVAGSVEVDGIDMLSASEAERDRVRGRRAAMVFQDPAEALNPYLRIGRQLELILARHRLASGGEARSRILRMFDAVRLPDPARVYQSYAHQLSGGMRQRVMLAAALITEPALLIADEPTTALDVTVQAQVLAAIEALRADTALLLITHDLGVVAGSCERMLVLEHGQLVEAGETAAVFATPGSPHTRDLIARAPRLDASPTLLAPGEELRLELRDLSLTYAAGGGVEAVKSVDLAIKSGETLAIVGESGCGKSSLAAAITGLAAAQHGGLHYRGAPLPARAAERPPPLRRAVQLVFQDPLRSLNPQHTLRRIVAEPLAVHAPELDRAARNERVRQALAEVGLDAELADRYPHELSGGQAQRVAIARALIVRPELLVCDEAVAALDGRVRQQIVDLLRDAQARFELSIVFIAHDLAVVRTLSHRVAVMYLGRIVELADNATLFERPQHPYTQALLAAFPPPDPAAPRPAAPVEGEPPSASAPPPGCAFHPRCRWAEKRCRQELPELRVLNSAQVACHRAEEIAAERG